jgi:predicted anti-sigma-YlaC factor YlaD
VSAAHQSVVCEPIHAQISLGLDGELSELEQRMLHTHLRRCPTCSAYAAEVTDFTTMLRNAPLEQMRRPIPVHSLRRVALARVHVGLAAAVAIAVVGSVLQLGLPGVERDTTLQQPSRFPTLTEGRNEMKQAVADGRDFKRHRSGPTVVI